MNDLLNFDPVSFISKAVFQPTTQMADGCSCGCQGCGLGAGSAGGVTVIQSSGCNQAA
ncbi:MAG TPA: hypothetical protein VKZ53_10470 [Candidatus Angelobacter sp.]|nr:hypothetical protein [Candidatus Angelobacter sp.]